MPSDAIDQTTLPTTKRRIFVAFEGGGAKGLVHIGALKALEAHNPKFCGVAGTSAGALIAALKAAGYTADEMFDTSGNKNILHLLKKHSLGIWKITDLFGKDGWRKIQAYRIISSNINIFVIFPMLLSCLFALLTLSDFAGLPSINIVWGASCFVFLLCAASLRTMYGGLASINIIRAKLNDLLATKMFPDGSVATPTMGMFGRDGRPALKIVAADISATRLRLFSSDNPEDRNIPVADIVAASIALPLIFRPWKIGQNRFVDGGIVSNLPVWPFDEERALDRNAVTVAFEIIPLGEASEQRGLIGRFIRTALFGGAILNKRAIENLEVIPIDTELRLLDFDASAELMAKAVKDAFGYCKKEIKERLFDVPKLYQDACDEMRSYAAEIATAFAPNDHDARVRVAIAVQEVGFRSSLRLKYCAGYENDGEEGMLLPIDHSLVGEAWKSGLSALYPAPFDPNLNMVGDEFQRLRCLLAKDISWIAVFPIFGHMTRGDAQQPALVVAIDGSAVLPDDESVLHEFGEALEVVVGQVFNGLLKQLMNGDD